MKTIRLFFIAMLILTQVKCHHETENKLYDIYKSHDSLIINNHTKNEKFLVYSNLPNSVNYFTYFDTARSNLYVYFDNKLLKYSMDSNKISGGVIFGNYPAYSEDSVIIENIAGKYIHLQTGVYNFILNEPLTKSYNLNYLVNDTLRWRYIDKISCKNDNNIMSIKFTLKNGKIINKSVDIDTLKFKSKDERWDEWKEHE